MNHAMKQYKDIKAQKISIKQRNRMIQNAYRTGILGIEQPGDPGSYYYSDKIIKEEQKKAENLEMRKTCIKYITLTIYDSSENNIRHKQSNSICK